MRGLTARPAIGRGRTNAHRRHRAAAIASLIAAHVLVAAGCGGARFHVTEPLLEMQLDEGPASEKPLTPGKPFEMLLRFDPGLPAFRLVRLRFRLAQPGRIEITVYSDEGGRPGKVLREISRDYGPQLVSPSAQGRWVVEELGAVPLGGAFFVGLWGSVKEGDPRLWATSNDSGAAFQRDTEPGGITKIPRTPVLRVEIAPTPASAATAATRR